MLDSLREGLSSIMRKLITGTVIDKRIVEEILKEMRKVLLRADVSIELTDNLIENIRKKCLEGKVPAGLTLREYVLKVVYTELVNLLGKEAASSLGKGKIMLIGLFGSGKTTSAGKLARYFQKQGLRPGLVACDYHRPAAPEQLKQLAKQINVPVHVDENKDPYRAAEDAIRKFAKLDVLIFDTAGRDALDEKLAEELRKLGEIIQPDEVLLVIPADIGKVCGKQAEEFNKLVGITGVFVTRMDGTAKAGGSLAATAATGAKIKFIGIGEKLNDIELYNPERFVSRLLGLGDLQTLLEKAREAEIKPEKVEKIVEGKFTLQDFYEQIEALQKMGPIKKLVGMIPGFSMLKLPEDLLSMQDEKMKNYRVIIQSMTPEERENPEIMNESRIKRVAKGSGKSESEVRELLQQYRKMKKLLKSLGGVSGLKRGQLQKLMKRFGFKM